MLEFLQDIFMLKKEDKLFVGLSQFKAQKPAAAPVKKQVKKTEIKLSDLMRRSV